MSLRWSQRVKVRHGNLYDLGNVDPWIKPCFTTRAWIIKYNLDTSLKFYGDVITTTRTYQTRVWCVCLDVRVRAMNVCIWWYCWGMGESGSDRSGLFCALANLDLILNSVSLLTCC